MKKINFLMLIIILGLFSSCTNDTEMVLFAVPKYKSLDAIRSSVNIESPRDTNSEGKIYVAENYLFYIAQNQGIHVFNNQNPASPQNVAFIRLDGVHDIAVKGHYLYADNYYDLLVFDISDINAISLEQTLDDVIEFYPVYPTEAEYFDFETSGDTNERLVGYELEYKAKPDDNYYGDDTLSVENALGAVGVGGSFAKFQIRNNALYTLNDWKLNIFNITNPTQATFDHDLFLNTWVSGQFETLFIQKQYLFIGSTDGVYILDLSNEFNPQFVSQFTHGTACDPVVVNLNTAYITIRGSNTCGAIEDQINVIDISNINQPTLSSTYLLSEPYGLGFRNNVLYVCSASDGLTIFDASNPILSLQNSYEFDVKDVIPLPSHLIAVGNQKIIQFEYQDNFELRVISEINF
jgi:hypothetical protein